MVAIVTGTGLGLDRSSAQVLGKLGLDGQVGDATFGRFGDKVYVNGANGNLMVERTDEVLIGQGLDDVISRSYNSESANAGYQSFHSWQFGDSRSVVVNPPNPINGNNSTVTLIDWDGSDLLYTYDPNANGTNAGAYVCHQAGHAADRLTFSGTTWTWTDGHTQTTEIFDSSNGCRLSASTDADGNQLSYTYDSTNGHLLSVQTKDGETSRSPGIRASSLRWLPPSRTAPRSPPLLTATIPRSA
jgi:YD repeat-containing protein